MTKTLLRNGTVLTLETGSVPLDGHDILIEDDKIAEIAPHIAADSADEIIDCHDRIVMPGFVNAHIHTWQTSLRGLSTDWTGTNYFRAMHAGLANFFTPDDIRIANLVGALNQIDNGVTTVADWHHNNPTPNHSDAAIDGLEDSGIRAVFLHGSAKPDPKSGQKHFSEIPMSRNEVARLRKGRLASDSSLVTMGLAILGPQWSVEDVALTDLRTARDFDLVTSMHHSDRKMPAPDGYAKAAQEGLIGPHVNVVHGNMMTDADLDLLAAAGATFTVTAEIEMQIAYGDPLTGRLIERGLPVSIGTDIESAYAPDMIACTRFSLQTERHLTSMRMMAATGERPHPVPITVREALRWATADGAHALRMGDRIGTLARGKQADIVSFRKDDLNLFGSFNPYNTVLGYAHPGNIDLVMIAGEVRKRDGKLLFQDLPQLLERLETSGRRIFEEFKEKSPTGAYA